METMVWNAKALVHQPFTLRLATRRLKHQLSILKNVSRVARWAGSAVRQRSSELSPRHRLAVVVKESATAVGTETVDGIEQAVGRLLGGLDIET